MKSYLTLALDYVPISISSKQLSLNIKKEEEPLEISKIIRLFSLNDKYFLITYCSTMGVVGSALLPANLNKFIPIENSPFEINEATLALFTPP